MVQETSFNGYDEAQKIDNRINSLFETYTINRENYLEWMKFAETIKTTGNIIERLALEIGEKIQGQSKQEIHEEGI